VCANPWRPSIFASLPSLAAFLGPVVKVRDFGIVPLTDIRSYIDPLANELGGATCVATSEDVVARLSEVDSPLDDLVKLLAGARRSLGPVHQSRAARPARWPTPNKGWNGSG
jgi:hypothetical protein